MAGLQAVREHKEMLTRGKPASETVNKKNNQTFMREETKQKTGTFIEQDFNLIGHAYEFYCNQ